MDDFLHSLGHCPIGQIFIAQIARALEHADDAGEDARQALHRFLDECVARDVIQTAEGDIDLEKSYVRPIIHSEPETYFFADGEKIDLDCQIATVMPESALRYLLRAEAIWGGSAIDGMADWVNDLDSDAFRPDARVGTRDGTNKDIFWATRIEDVLEVLPEIDGDDPINPRKLSDLRNHLGLGHINGEVRIVLVIFAADALQRHAEEARAKRPFLLDGAGNLRFHLFDRPGDNGWNYALHLERAVEGAEPLSGGREIVLSSMPCSYIERCVWLGDPGGTPCFDKDGIVCDRMLGACNLTHFEAVQRVADFMRRRNDDDGVSHGNGA